MDVLQLWSLNKLSQKVYTNVKIFLPSPFSSQQWIHNVNDQFENRGMISATSNKNNESKILNRAEFFCVQHLW